MRNVPVLTLVSLVAALAMVAAPASAAVLTNGPAIDDNNRIVGTTGNNIFYNGIVPGEAAESVVNLEGWATGGDSPVGVSAVGIVTIGTVSLDADRARTATIEASGSNAATVDGQLEVSVNDDGSYVVSALDGLDAAYIVTIGVSDEAGVAATHLLAAPAVAPDLSGWGEAPAGTLAQGTVTKTADTLEFSGTADQGTLVYSPEAVAVGEYATVSIDYESDSADVTIAAIGFDGAIDGTVVNYMQVAGSADVEVGAVKNIAVTLKSFSGSVLPAVQVTGAGSVTVTDVKVIKACPITDYALNPTATIELPADYSENVNGQDAGPVTASDDGLTLAGTQGGDTLSNAFYVTTAGGGAVVAEIYAQNAGGEGFFALVATNGASTINSYVNSANIPADSFAKVVVGGTLSVEGPMYLVAQASTFDAVVKDAAVRVLDDAEGEFDANLIP